MKGKVRSAQKSYGQRKTIEKRVMVRVKKNERKTRIAQNKRKENQDSAKQAKQEYDQSKTNIEYIRIYQRKFSYCKKKLPAKFILRKLNSSQRVYHLLTSKIHELILR